ncbi:hypothetical protein EI94DRAFT_1629737, partial [Lactarius quietus]
MFLGLNLDNQCFRSALDDLECDAVDICAHLFGYGPTSTSVSAWALQITQSTLHPEVEEMTKKKNGLHFNACTVTSEQIELAFMPRLAGNMRFLAPNLWGLVFNLLGPLDDQHVSGMVDPLGVNLAKLFDASEDLGDLGEDEEVEEGPIGDDNGPGAQPEDERRPQKWLRKDVSARNTALRKSVVCISIILQGANESCNHLQGIIGMFVHSANVPQHVIEVLAHAGLSISIKSIQRAVKSMSIDSAHKIRDGLCTLKVAMAYDNFDINFKMSEPTVTHCSNFVSATLATVIPLVTVDDINALHGSVVLWDADPHNPSPSTPPAVFDDFDLLKFHVMDTYNRRMPGKEFSPQCEAFAWHIREILVNHGQYFAHFLGQLGALKPVLEILLMKTEQIPMRLMKIKQSSVDGNIEVMDSLLRQGGLGDPTEP